MSDFEDNEFQDDDQGFEEDNNEQQLDEEEAEGEDLGQLDNPNYQDEDSDEEDDQGISTKIYKNILISQSVTLYLFGILIKKKYIKAYRT